MAYISTAEVKEIRNELKKEFPNLRFSVVREHYQKVNVSIMKGDLDFSELIEEYGRDYVPVNHYYLERMGKFQKLFEKINSIIKTAPAKAEGGEEWYDRSDAMVDYFDTAFYYSINIGKWGKPYELKA